MKRFFAILLIVICLVPFCVYAKDKKEDKKVKVYVFEAGGCPYCEAETEYLKGLSSYNKKFVIVSKELYVDHVNWEQGKDYDLGVSVASEFNKAGFADASSTGTPFVVISDIFAATGYSTDLEEVINQAYKEGDKDAVSCISKGKDDCVRINEEALKKAAEEEAAKEKAKETHGGVAILILGGIALVGAIVYTFVFKKNTNSEIDEFDDEDDVEEEEETEELEEKEHEEKYERNQRRPIRRPNDRQNGTRRPVRRPSNTKTRRNENK